MISKMGKKSVCMLRYWGFFAEPKVHRRKEGMNMNIQSEMIDEAFPLCSWFPGAFLFFLCAIGEMKHLLLHYCHILALT